MEPQQDLHMPFDKFDALACGFAAGLMLFLALVF